MDNTMLDGKSELWVKFFEEEKEKLQKQLSIGMSSVSANSFIPTKPMVSFRTTDEETMIVCSSSSTSFEPKLPILAVANTEKAENISFSSAEQGKMAKYWAEGIVSRHQSGKHTQKQELLLKLLKMRGQVQLEHECLLQSQRSAILRALQSEFESYIKVELNSRFSGNLLTSYLDCIEAELLPLRNHTKPNASAELISIVKPQTQQIVQMIQLYQESKLKRAKNSVRLNISKQTTAFQNTLTKSGASNDNAVKWALKVKLEGYCQDELKVIDEQFLEEEDDVELSDVKKQHRQNLALAGQIALLQNILIQRRE